MYNLNTDIIIVILKFLSNKECINFITSNKFILNNYGSKGFIKKLNINTLSSHKLFTSYDLFNIMTKHLLTLENINIYNINDPHLWMPFWVKYVSFNYCNFTDGNINPNKKVNTETLYIKSNQSKLILNINWTKFPYLKSIYIDAYCLKTPPPANINYKL